MDDIRRIWAATTNERVSDHELAEKWSVSMSDGLIGESLSLVESSAASASYMDRAGKIRLLAMDWREALAQHKARRKAEAEWKPRPGYAQSRPLRPRFASGHRRPPGRATANAPYYEASSEDWALISELCTVRRHPFTVSYSPDLRLWPGTKTGYHREHERDYITGYSALLDSLGDAVAEHRGAEVGGRIYLWSAGVECADCTTYIATFEPGALLPAAGQCRQCRPGR